MSCFDKRDCYFIKKQHFWAYAKLGWTSPKSYSFITAFTHRTQAGAWLLPASSVAQSKSLFTRQLGYSHKLAAKFLRLFLFVSGKQCRGRYVSCFVASSSNLWCVQPRVDWISILGVSVFPNICHDYSRQHLRRCQITGVDLRGIFCWKNHVALININSVGQ